ncbi:unnamed protein product [Chondrus crispus]|uniref:Uncharacterized protein n=1 Tax=Chondrus crispus TaxID=2769 RepID=R7QSE0_CHOCR|nr:unnamed protein product [Chondrus crispus]CDF41019.1 unnamed protein product [Chondrus crispus]|eukprot:XP_005711313.1 unnamed protein product [Chondrus crispus]
MHVNVYLRGKGSSSNILAFKCCMMKNSRCPLCVQMIPVCSLWDVGMPLA